MVTELYSTEQVRSMEQQLIEAGTPGDELMRRAGLQAFKSLLNQWPDVKSLTVLCGKGNNGGDGLIVAALAHEHGMRVRLICTAEPKQMVGEAASAVLFAEQSESPQGAQLKFEEATSFLAHLNDAQVSTDLIVDALLGIGAKGAATGQAGELIRWINQQPTPVFALDVPSGLDADTGASEGQIVNADVTISFIAHKQGMWTGDGKACSGQVQLADLNAANRVVNQQLCSVQTIDPQPLLGLLVRGQNAHKGDSGHVGLLGGDHGMAGAALLSAESCLRAGAGLISLYTRQSHVLAVHTRLPEVMARGVEDDSELTDSLSKHSVIAVGPGLGKTAWARQTLSKALSVALPKVIDADALNLIASGELLLPEDQRYILTPHPGEAARLLQTSADQIQSNRYGAVKQLQQRYGGVVVLKGSGTLIADSRSIYVCTAGNPGMAVCGMGDVLVGCIAAMLAQGLALLDAAKLGVWVHSRAADVAVHKDGELGLKASDLFPFIRRCINGNTD